MQYGSFGIDVANGAAAYAAGDVVGTLVRIRKALPDAEPVLFTGGLVTQRNAASNGVLQFLLFNRKPTTAFTDNQPFTLTADEYESLQIHAVAANSGTGVTNAGMNGASISSSALTMHGCPIDSDDGEESVGDLWALVYSQGAPTYAAANLFRINVTYAKAPA